ncbi:hypothetical protein B0H14DRAFT_3421591 [Mycena olivaceomarginata]|nr:hypothetical protein B0H14DRAFT_3421591 [Mycena olivaceomarginata]
MPVDLISPMRVNKSFHGLIEPMIWTQVELHGPGYHEYYLYPEELVDSESRQKRNYLATGADYNPDNLERQYIGIAHHFLGLFSYSEKGLSSMRRIALAEHVRFLCLDLTYDTEDLPDPWGTIARFPNLEHLEVFATWPWRGAEYDTAFGAFASKEHRPLTKLRTLRLRGENYVEKRTNPPPGTKAKVGSDDEDSASDKDSEDSDTEDFDQEAIAPRALPALLDKIDLIGQFSSLTRLSLARPTESSEEMYYREEYVSHLILEQRPFAEDIAQDSSTDEEFLVLYPYGAGYDRFVEHALPALLEEGAGWPRLKSVRLYGFDVPVQDFEKYYPKKTSPQTEVTCDLGGTIQAAGVDVRSGLGRRMIYDETDGTIRSGEDGFGGIRWDDSEQEDDSEAEDDSGLEDKSESEGDSESE